MYRWLSPSCSIETPSVGFNAFAVAYTKWTRFISLKGVNWPLSGFVMRKLSQGFIIYGYVKVLKVLCETVYKLGLARGHPII